MITCCKNLIIWNSIHFRKWTRDWWLLYTIWHSRILIICFEGFPYFPHFSNYLIFQMIVLLFTYNQPLFHDHLPNSASFGYSSFILDESQITVHSKFDLLYSSIPCAMTASATNCYVQGLIGILLFLVLGSNIMVTIQETRGVLLLISCWRVEPVVHWFPPILHISNQGLGS